MNTLQNKRLNEVAVILFFLLMCTAFLSGQIDLEKEYGLKEGVITSDHIEVLTSLDFYRSHDQKFKKITDYLESEEKDEVLNILLLEKYMKPENLNDEYFRKWLIQNLIFQVDKNVYTFQTSMRKDKYQILNFLVQNHQLAKFNVRILAQSDFMNNCELFSDYYTKLFTCKLLASFIISTDGFYLGENPSGVSVCALNNLKQISNICKD